MAFCSKCGTQVTEETKFCPNCGNNVSASNSDQQMNTGQANNQQTGYTQANSQENYNQPNYGQQNVGGNVPSFMNTADTTAQYSVDDINQNKVMAALSYFGILWLIPFLGAKHSPFAKFHLKQAFLLVCSEIVWGILSFIIHMGFRNSVRISSTWRVSMGTPWGISLILWLVNIAFLAFSVLGIVNAVQGKAKELPFIGKFSKNFTFLN